MIHCLMLGADCASTRHTAALIRRFDTVSGAQRGDHGLALIARRSVDVVALSETLGDMSAITFADQVWRWHPRRRPRLVLLTDDASPAAPPGALDHFDASIVHDIDSGALALTLQCIARHGRTEGTTGCLSGTFDGVDLPSLLQVIAQRHRTGRLVIDGGDFEGCVLYEDGAPIHASMGDLDGRRGFHRLLRRSIAHPDAHFHFEPIAVEAIRSLCPTIGCTLETLLLEAA